MKHTDFYKLIEEIKLQEQCELKAAIKSVGGCYIWDIYDGEAEYPIIAVNMDSISLNPTDVEIYEVQIVNNVLKIKGRDKESREVVEFEPNDVIVVDHKDRESVFSRLDEDRLKIWLEEDYALGDLWKRNILGGRP